MEEHVRKQLANAEAGDAKSDAEIETAYAASQPNRLAQESEKLPPTDPNIKTMYDIVQAIKQGDEDVGKALVILSENSKHLDDSIAEIAVRIANIETFMEAQQLSNVTILDKLAKIAMSFVVFVGKFGTKKDEADAKDEIEE